MERESVRPAGREDGAVLNYILNYRAAKGYPPSRREVAERFGMSLDAVQRVLAHMVEEGIITVVPGAARAINITETGMKAARGHL